MSASIQPQKGAGQVKPAVITLPNGRDYFRHKLMPREQILPEGGVYVAKIVVSDKLISNYPDAIKEINFFAGLVSATTNINFMLDGSDYRATKVNDLAIMFERLRRAGPKADGGYVFEVRAEGAHCKYSTFTLKSMLESNLAEPTTRFMEAIDAGEREIGQIKALPLSEKPFGRTEFVVGLINEINRTADGLRNMLKLRMTSLGVADRENSLLVPITRAEFGEIAAKVSPVMETAGLANDLACLLISCKGQSKPGVNVDIYQSLKGDFLFDIRIWTLGDATNRYLVPVEQGDSFAYQLTSKRSLPLIEIEQTLSVPSRAVICFETAPFKDRYYGYLLQALKNPKAFADSDSVRETAKVRGEFPLEKLFELRRVEPEKTG